MILKYLKHSLIYKPPPHQILSEAGKNKSQVNVEIVSYPQVGRDSPNHKHNLNSSLPLDLKPFI